MHPPSSMDFTKETTMTLSAKAIAHFQKHPGASVSAVAKKYSISPSYAHKLKVKAQDGVTIVAAHVDGAWQTGNVATALNTQIGGGHYKNNIIQPVEFIHANGLNFLEGCIVKRITRWRLKDGFTDLEKIKHEVDLLIEMEKKYASGN